MTDEEKQRAEIRISQLPVNMNASAKELVKNLDVDGDGVIDLHEFAAAVTSLKNERNNAKFLTKVIFGLIGFVFCLVSAVFGVSIAAARIAQDTTIDPATGFVTAKDGNAVMKTSPALTTKKGVSIHNIPKDEMEGVKKNSLARWSNFVPRQGLFQRGKCNRGPCGGWHSYFWQRRID